MTCRTADQTAQNIATALVGRHDAVGDHESTGLHMVSDDTQGNIFLIVYLILGVCQGTNLIQKCLVGIYGEQGIYILNNHGQTLQTHTGINILLL